MAAIATRASWKTLPLPEAREHFDLPLFFDDTQGERLRVGHIPVDMDDKWFICFDEGWLYFYRSWTGDCIFGLRLDGSSAGVRVIEAWASRDQDRYRTPGVDQEKILIGNLINSRLLD